MDRETERAGLLILAKQVRAELANLDRLWKEIFARCEASK